MILAKAVSLAAGRMPVGQIATELGYSPSAFSAMVRKSVGAAPAQFLGSGSGHRAFIRFSNHC